MYINRDKLYIMIYIEIIEIIIIDVLKYLFV